MNEQLQCFDDEELERELVIRKRVRQKQERKARREAAIYRDKIEMEALRRKNEELEQRMFALDARSNRLDLHHTDKQLEELEEAIRVTEQFIAKAIAECNGDDAAAALKRRDQYMQKIFAIKILRSFGFA